MNQSTKGALLSGLIFPGLGQVVFKCYKRGVALIVTVSICMVVIVATVLQKAFSVLEKIELEGKPIDLETISNAAAQASAASNSFIYNFIMLLIVCCWVFGIVDAYRTGKKIDGKE